MPAMESVENPKWRTVNSDWLWEELRATEAQVVVLDCRSAKQFGDCHIRQAVHLSLPSIMLRRIAAGKVTISSVLKCSEARQRIAEAYDKHTFVLCGEMASADRHPHEIMAVIYKTLMQDGCRVVCLEGGVQDFSSKYPEWCVSCENASGSASLSNLRLLSSTDLGPRPSNRSINRSASYAGRPGSLGSRSASESEEERPDSSLEVAEGRGEESDLGLGISVGLRLGLDEQPPLGLEDPDPEVEAEIDPGFPVEILPHLFLGNAQNSRDCDALSKHHIRYVVNVTPNLPNVFEDTGLIQYLQIPITDHWSENLANFFPSAISFIDAARDREEGVLVHCLAGISRSVTITVAYLMFKMSMSLNDAYDFVRRRKSNISPNFNFMGQLLDFERQLNPPSPKRCTCNRNVNSMPDPLESHKKFDVDTVELPMTLLSMDEKVDSPTDSGLPSSVSLSPCSTDSSSSSPALSNAKRLTRNFVCRCQASLAQCHFTSPTKL